MYTKITTTVNYSGFVSSGTAHAELYKRQKITDKNTQFNTHEILNNTQSSVYFHTFLMSIIFRPIFLVILFIPNALRLPFPDAIPDNFVQNPRKGNRTLVGVQTWKTTPAPAVRKSYAKRR